MTDQTEPETKLTVLDLILPFITLLTLSVFVGIVANNFIWSVIVVFAYNLVLHSIPIFVRSYLRSLNMEDRAARDDR